MATEILGHMVDASATEMALHSEHIMTKFANGEAYNEAIWIERGRYAVRQTMEGMFELGRALIVIKEHTPHGKFTEIIKNEFGLHERESRRLMNATLRFLDPQMQKAAPKLMDLGKSKLLELLVEEDVTLTGLADGGEVAGMTFDDVDRMTVRELRLALRENREQLAAKDKVLGDKNAKIDELAEKLEKTKKKGSVKEPAPADVGNELHMAAGTKEVAIRSQIVQLGEYFAQMAAHEQAHGISHRAKMVGIINQIIMDCEHLREQYGLPEDIPDGEMPEWMRPESTESE